MGQDHTGTANPLTPDGVSTTNEDKADTANKTTVEPVPPATLTTDPITSPSTPTPLADPKKPKGLIAAVIILAILALAGIAFGVYGMFLKPEPKCEANCQETSNDSSNNSPQTPTDETEKYILSDYVSFTEVSIPITFPDELQKGHTEDIVKKVEFKNLPESVISKFNNAQNELMKEDGYVITVNNIAGATINDNILSAYTLYNYHSIYGDRGNMETLNYNFETKKELSNEELISLYNLTGSEVYTSILQQLTSNVTAESFLLSTIGDVTAPTISMADFVNNIPEYANTLSSNLGLSQFYIDDNNKVHALYTQKDILEALGMGTHMGIGLASEVQDAIL